MDSKDKLLLSESLCALSFVGCLFFLFKKLEVDQKAKIVEKCRVWSPSRLSEFLQKQTHTELMTKESHRRNKSTRKLFQNLKESFYLVKFDAMVEGLLTSDGAFRSKVNPSVQVVYSQIEVPKTHPFGGFYAQTFGKLFEKQRVFLPSQRLWTIKELKRNEREASENLNDHPAYVIHRDDLFIDPKLLKTLRSDMVYKDMTPWKRTLLQFVHFFSQVKASLVSLFPNQFEVIATSKEFLTLFIFSFFLLISNFSSFLRAFLLSMHFLSFRLFFFRGSTSHFF